MGIAENLAHLQRQRGESNYALAKAVGASQTSIQNWKCGRNVPHRFFVNALAAHYGVSADELLGDTIIRTKGR